MLEAIFFKHFLVKLCDIISRPNKSIPCMMIDVRLIRVALITTKSPIYTANILLIYMAFELYLYNICYRHDTRC